MKKSVITLVVLATTVNATELVHKFGSPSFSGINQSAHYLTIDEQERTRKEALAQKAQDALDEAQREAEVKQKDIEYKDRDHALFVAFAPYKNPQYAISVLVEHGGSGGKAAAPIARKVIKKVLERHELRERVNKLIGEPV